MEFIKRQWTYFARKHKEIRSSIRTDLKNNPVDAIIRILTEMGSSIGAFGIFLVLGLVSGFEIWVLFPIYLLQLLIVELIKLVFKRPRPQGALEHKNVFGMPASSGSFPSGHASNAFTMALLFSYYYSLHLPGTLVLLALAILIAVSRIYLKKHYIVDIIGGSILGFTLTYLILTNLY